MISIHAPLAGSAQGRGVYARCLRISIHAPLAGSDANAVLFAVTMDISIHAPLAGSDVAAFATLWKTNISIHAPLAGSDHLDDPMVTRPFYFNPRSPRGERQINIISYISRTTFQSTLPSRGATY